MNVRRAAWSVLAIAVVIGLAFSVTAIWHKTKESIFPTCTVGSGDSAVDVTTDQAAVASTMVGVVTTRGLPEHAAVLVLAAAWQESKLTNLAAGEGDRDSVGVLQQRPSQGWGSAAQLSDVRYATGAFLTALVKYRDWKTAPLAEAIQRVQVSADGSAYNQHATEAKALADALLGQSPGSFTCTFEKPTVVASTAKVASALLGDLPVNQPTASTTQVSVPGARWQTVMWFIANADRLGIDSVAFGGKVWSRAHGWASNAAAGSSAVVATMAQVRPSK